MILQEFVVNNILSLCPIDGVSFGGLSDKSTWRIDYNASATQAQKDAAQLYFDNLDLNQTNNYLNKIKDDEAIVSLYDNAMLTLQNGYTDEEVKTFTPKQDAIREYLAGGVAGLSTDNRAMLEGLTGSTDDAVITAKLDNMVSASATFKNYLGVIERLRDEHLAQIVEGQDNSAVIASLEQAYSALG